MRSALLGKRTSVAEVTNIGRAGFWLLVHGRELFVSFRRFPWFRKASVEQILGVTLPHQGHLYWPELDIDLAVESIEHPERFPLISRVRPNYALQRTRAGRASRRRGSLRARR
jgi:hypothetical protein